MKWLLIAFAVALVAVFAVLQSRSVKTTYVNGLPPYTSLPGLEYILERDCYVFKLKGHDTDWPLLGTRDTVPELPAEVTPANIGADLSGVRILDVIHVGDHFRIASVRREESRKGTTISFEVLLSDESSRKYPRLDVFWMLDHSPEATGAAPKILPEFAVQLRKQ